MKYWIYKGSRILGPFDKEGVSELPGLNSGTLVCEGDPAGGAWVPAGEISNLAGLAMCVPRADFGGVPSSIGILDQLEIDTAGLIGDDFSGSLAESLFQDADLKKGFIDAHRWRDKVSELTAQLERLYQHITQLQSGQIELTRRLAEAELELRRRGSGSVLPESIGLVSARESLSEGDAGRASGKVSELSQRDAGVVLAKAAAPLPGAPVQPPPAVAATVPAPDPAAASAPVELSNDWSQATGVASPLPSFASPVAPKPVSFDKPKSFKIVPTIKSFKVLGADEAAPTATPNPVPQFMVPEPVAMLVPVPVATPEPVPVATPEPVIVAPVVLAPAPVPLPIVAPLPVPVSTPASPPPNTLSRSQPVPDIESVSDDAANAPPPATMASSMGASAEAPAAASADNVVAARFAKAEPATSTGASKRERSNKPVLIAGAVLLVLIVIVGVIFMRQPKDDLKQMATLDDGKAPIGLPADDSATALSPMAKPKFVAPVPALSAAHQAAIAAVKDFPLDGGRVTVGRWLQQSYAANPGAGTEAWSASAAGGSSVLVEYRIVPSAPEGRSALYLFELDANGLVMGRNRETSQMLSGGFAPEPSAEYQAAIAAVKNFPLDGDRGTVGRWLQYSYTASPGSGTEEWNASTTGENAVLVEYRLVPGASSGRGALYLFEVEENGLVIGKNIEARQMLAGGPPPGAPSAKKKAKASAKKAVRRRPVVEEPKKVPLLPLPDSGELRPPAEDDGSFGSDTINSGI